MLRGSVFDRTLEFFAQLKAAGIAITSARAIDAFRALECVDCLDEHDYRLALSLNLVGSPEEQGIFDREFAFHFGNSVDTREIPSGIRGEPMKGRLGLHEKSLDQAVITEPEQFSADDTGQRVSLAERWDNNLPPLERTIRELAKRLATRRSRRYREARRGSEIDLRGSVRRNLRYGLDILDLARREKRIRRTRLVMLCDVSGSMDTFNPFLLRLMLGLQQVLRNSRTLVFSTHVTEISRTLRFASVTETLQEVANSVRHWSGGTDIGGAIAKLNRGAIREGSAGSTIAVIISDGYDNGDAERVGTEMAQLRRHVRKIVWINPMYGASTFQVRAAGMKAAMPFIDHFLPAFDANSLTRLVRSLKTI